MHRRWSSHLRSRKGAQTFEYIAIIAAALLIALALYNFLSGGEVKQTITTKIQQILAGESSGITASDGGEQPESKPKPDKKPAPEKKEEKDKPFWKKVIDNPIVQETTNFVLDSVPIVSNIKAGYEAVTGKDIFGNELSAVDRAVSGAAIFIPGAKHGKRAVKAVDKGIDLAKGAGKKGPKRKGCACKSKDKKGKNKPPTKITFSSESKKHVNDRHIGNKPGWEHKSKWTVDGGQWVTYSRTTFRKPDRFSKDGDRFIYEKEFKEPVGVDPKTGEELYKVRVVVEADGEVVTAFPQKDWK